MDDGALMPGTEVRVGSQEHPQEGLVRGPGVFLGYLDETDNELAFEGDWYRTGDLVEVSEGRLTVVGRLKEVVNRNGFKISLAEIDAAMFDMKGLDEAASFALPDAVTGERLAVAILPSHGAVIDLEDVTSHLRPQEYQRAGCPRSSSSGMNPYPGRHRQDRPLPARHGRTVQAVDRGVQAPTRGIAGHGIDSHFEEMEKPMTTTREPTGDEHAAITNLLAHYCLSLDHDDVETWVSLFTEDGSFDVYGRSFDGREGLRKMMAAAPKGLHLGGPPLIRMHDADRAQTEQNLLFIDRQSGDSQRGLPG